MPNATSPSAQRHCVLSDRVEIMMNGDGWEMCAPIFVTFLILFAMHLCFTAMESKRGRRFTKPFLMPLLLLLYLQEAEVVSSWVVLALIGGTLGDIFLLWPDDDRLFAAGLTSFLAGHVFYIIAILQTIDWSAGIPWWFWLAIIPYATCGWYSASKLAPDLGKMKVPANVYGVVITVMSLLTILRASSFSGWSFWLPFVGSLLFIASDSMLSHHRFRAKMHDADLYIMATYVLAQLFLVVGLLMG